MDNLKDIVVNKLESGGILGEIRAKLKTHVYKILEEQDTKTKADAGFSIQSTQYKAECDKNPVLNLGAEIIREFLEFYKLDYSLQIFVSECSLPSIKPSLTDLLSKSGLSTKENLPILVQLINGKFQIQKEDTQEPIIKLKENNLQKPASEGIPEQKKNQSPNNELKKEEPKKEAPKLENNRKIPKKADAKKEAKKEEEKKLDSDISKAPANPKNSLIKKAESKKEPKPIEPEKDSLTSLKNFPPIISIQVTRACCKSTRNKN